MIKSKCRNKFRNLLYEKLTPFTVDLDPTFPADLAGQSRTKISPKLHLTAHVKEIAQSPEEPLFMRPSEYFGP
jgi:hypothetical protein